MNKAWKTISRVNDHSFDTGDDVYFKCGETWSGTNLSIDWNGSGNDRTIIGAYYNNGGIPAYGVSGSRPIIDGSNWTFPSSEKGLIDCTNNTGGFITIKDLYVKHSKYYGIIIKNCGIKNLVENCYVYRSKMHGIILGRVNNSTVTRCTVEESSYLTKPMGGIVVSAYGIEGRADNNTISYNTVFHAYEGINGASRKARWSIVEYNVVYDCRSFHIYVDASKFAIVRYNLSYSSSDTSSWNGPSYGIVVDNENARGYCYTGGNEIYGNLVAFNRYGISLLNEYQRKTNSNCTQDDNIVYNNTIIDSAGYNIRVWDAGKNNWSGNEIKNNISLTVTAGSFHVYGSNSTGVTWSNNLFDENPGGNAATNAVIGDPKLLKTSGWRSIPPGTATGTEWSIQAGSAAQGKGLSINGYMEKIYDCDFTADPITVKKKTDVTPDIGAWMTIVLAKPGSISPPQGFWLKSNNKRVSFKMR